MQARGAIANFMGHIEVQPEESNYRLTPGLWLVGPSARRAQPFAPEQALALCGYT